MKHEIKYKRKGKKDLLALGEENLAKRTEENEKNLMVSLVRFGEREKSLKNFWKVSLNKSNSVFKKPDSWFSIDWKSVSIDRNRQRFTKKFWTYAKFRFLMIQAKFSEINQWVFVLGCYELDLDGLILSIWWILRNWNF